MANLWLIFGASRGFGEELASLVLQRDENTFVTAYNRSPLSDRFNGNERISYQKTDLSDLTTLPNLFEASLQKLNQERQWEKVYIIHCSAMLGPLSPVKNLTDIEDIRKAIDANYTSKFITNSIFLRIFENKKLTIVDISSGAHKIGADNWSVYCSTKAAQVILHKSIAAEQPSVRILSYSPGIMKTQMQAEIASAPDCGMKSFLGEFIAQGKDIPVKESAGELLKVIDEDTFESGSFVDVYERRPEYAPQR